MEEDKDAASDFDKGAYTVFHHKEMKTAPDYLQNHNDNKEVDISNPKIIKWYSHTKPVIFNYITLAIIGLLIWGYLWCIWQDNWAWDGQWFRIAAVAVIAWASGHVLNTLTGLPPLLAALITGILARNLEILDMGTYPHIDFFLRKIYPSIILGKASLGWDLSYMRSNWSKIAVLGTVPWLTEVTTTALCVHLYLGFPLIWGFLLGSIYASVSCAVVMPPVSRISKAAGSARNWPLLLCTAGGIETAFSVGVYGIIYSFMFYETNETYRFVKAALTLVAGVALGIVMGSVAGLIPNSKDFYVTELRITMVVVGGLLANTLTSHIGWGGAGGVAVLVCNATAASFWAQDGWKLNNNPASTAYRVMWSALEPALFAYTGTFFEISHFSAHTLLAGCGILAVCLFVRLLFTCISCWEFSLKEKVFICCTWIPKSIVEAVLCPLTIDTLRLTDHGNSPEMEYATDIMRLMVLAILITTPVGYLLTNHWGPILLKAPIKDCEADTNTQKRRPVIGPQMEDMT